jgi:hypothetical protein
VPSHLYQHFPHSLEAGTFLFSVFQGHFYPGHPKNAKDRTVGLGAAGENWLLDVDPVWDQREHSCIHVELGLLDAPLNVDLTGVCQLYQEVTIFILGLADSGKRFNDRLSDFREARVFEEIGSGRLYWDLDVGIEFVISVVDELETVDLETEKLEPEIR